MTLALSPSLAYTKAVLVGGVCVIKGRGQNSIITYWILAFIPE